MNTTPASARGDNGRYSISGTVRNQYQQPMPGVIVTAFDKDIRSEQALGKTQTNEQGYYTIAYSQQQFADTDKDAADVFLRLYNPAGAVLKQTDIFYNAPAQLTIDISLSAAPYKGISELEQVLAAVTPYTGKLTLDALTENADVQDITFLINKTGLSRDRIEALAMAYRFQSQTKIYAAVFYGLLREGVPGDTTQRLLQNISAPTYEQLLNQKLEGMMYENIDVLMKSFQQAITNNIIPFSLSAEAEKIKEQLLRVMIGYKQQHPETGITSVLFQKVQGSGLSPEDTKRVMEDLSKHRGDYQSFFAALNDDPTFPGNTDRLDTVFQLSQLTGDHLPLVNHLVNTQDIKKVADIKKLAAKTAGDWEKIITEQKLEMPPSSQDSSFTDRVKTFAKKLESTFAKKFPTTAFTAKLKQDDKAAPEQKSKLVDFFDVNPDFDLEHHRIENFLSANPAAIAPEAKPLVAGQLRRLQRVFKMAPTYEASSALLGKGIHSSQQIYSMGKDLFMKTFAADLGKKETSQIFNNAAKMYASTIAIAGNMHGLATASKLSVLPNYQDIMKASAAAKEIPNLDVLFQHVDFCECDECRSVYGAASYLTDVLHFLSQRMTDSTGTVRDRLLERRPDIGDIDLNCDNTNTQLPYIDIVNEILEEAIVPSVFSIATSFSANLPVFVPLVNTDPLPDKQHAINTALLNELTTHTADVPHIDVLLTKDAMVSDAYQAMGSSSTQWIIRDKFIVLKLTANAAKINVQLLHQTLLSTDELSANPEYTNVKVYDNFLKTAKRAFGLPFDLFSTEGNIYLTKLGIGKADLVRIFVKEHLPVANPPAVELEEAFAFLEVSFEERDLIFKEDLINSANYWGTMATSASVEVDLFLQYTGLEYADLQTLLNLQFINPLKDSKIDHDDVSCDLDKQHITNVSPTKFDRIHRFLRLFKKLSFRMEELDACIQCPAIGNGKLDTSFAWQLHHLLQLKNRLDLEIFPLLAFYEDIQSTGEDNLYNNLFQNKQITYPLNPDFALVNVNSGIAITDIHKSVIQSATFISGDELNVLLADNAITTLTLANLSSIYRNVLLMQSQSFTADDVHIAKQVIPDNIFASPVDTMDFLAKNDLLNTAGITIWELNYILRQQNDANNSFVPAEEIIASNLGELENALLQIQAATSVQPDANGDLLTKWLNDPLLKWDASITAKLIAILKTIDDDAYVNNIIPANYTFLKNLRVQYDQPFHEVTLTNLTPVETLSQLSANINYNSGTKQLEFTGAMTANEQTALLAAFSDQDYADAVNQLFTDSQGSANTTAALDALPPLTAYAPAAGQLIYDSNKKALRFIGYMDAALRDALKNFYNNPNPVRDALDNLFGTQQTDNSSTNIFFASNGDIDTNLKTLDFAHVAQRFELLLQKIAPFYKNIQQQSAIQNRISSWFSVDKTIAAQLLVSLPAIYTDWTNTAFVQKINTLNSTNYAAQFNQYLRVAKICFVVNKLKIDATALDWILTNAAAVTITDLNTLPLAPVVTPVSANDFTSFENLINLFNLHHSYAFSNSGATIINILQDVIDGTKTLDAIETELSGLYGWDKTELNSLVEAPNYLNLLTAPPASSDLKNIRILVRLYKCFSAMALLGVKAEDCINWSKPFLSFDDATKIKQTLKSNYADSDWLDVTQPLQNKLREAKRDALVTWLLANPGTNTWKNASDLYSYFLIDVEMSACQPTSRIVQATNAVQQFVQRCFMSMETDITVNADDPDQGSFDSKWKQWEWMKYYRLWEANRKVFLYPENWIEPELLPNQSSFFKDLQNQLLQNEVTQPNAEDAFMAYLEKLDGVARLEVKGMWYQDDNQTLHVIGRTYGGDPKIYYYRQYVENRRWTAWEKIDLDINSDHIVPVVFNQRLYIFWALFTEKARETPDTLPVPDLKESAFPIQKPDKYWQIQMAFSEYKKGKWSPKKISNNDVSGIIEVSQFYDKTQQVYTPAKSKFLFSPVDLPQPDFSNLATYIEKKDIKGWWGAFLNDIENSLKQNGTLNINCYVVNDNNYYSYKGTFDLDPCRGYPVVTNNYVQINPHLFTRSGLDNMLDDESGSDTTNNFLAFPAQSSILNNTPGLFRNCMPLQAGFFDRMLYLMQVIFKANQYAFSDRKSTITLGTFLPFFYQDATYQQEKTGRTYYVTPEFSDNDTFELFYSDMEAWFLQLLELLEAIIAGDTAKEAEIKNAMPQIPQGKRILVLYHFYNFYHPMSCYFMRQLFNKGIDGLMSRQTQLKGDIAYDPNPAKFSFNTTYAPQFNVYRGQPVTYPNAVTDNTPGYPREDVDFNIQSGYALYNWELFYHAPLMIGMRLSENQQFEDADKWFKYIFNPADSSPYPAPDKFWVTKPFFMNVVNVAGKTKYDLQRIENIMFGTADPASAHPNDLDKSVEDWRVNPFQPHFIAQYRTVAYQKTTVMKYLDHLIRWGDYLFTQHTMESVTEATQLYVLAGQILGNEPKIIPPAYEVPVNNYYQLEKKLDTFSNVLVEIENLLPMHTYQGLDFSNPDNPDLPSLQALYFCIPFNDNILQYWKTIADRLFKIRHCLDIQGVFSPLSLFAPPIDPGMLVRATAAGLDLSSVLNDMNAPLPFYRFVIMIQKATELCNEVKSLGASLLAALEKKDAEHIALLRSGQEIKLLSAVLKMKELQISESDNQLKNLIKQKELLTIRRDYYQNLLSSGLNSGETIALALNTASTIIDTGVAIGYTLAGGLKLIPDFILGASGFGGSPHATVTTGGQSFGNSAEDLARTLQSIATALDKNASLMSTNASYQRRADEWRNQLNNANKELEQVDVQILGAQIRQEIANTDKENQQLQIDNAKESDDFMHSKYTNEDLYAWMIGKISTTYFQSYQLAYDAAKKAERCFRYELGLNDSDYIQFGYWDSMKKGLQSGESLMYNLKQMEMAYYEKNRREYELTKYISLAQLDAVALLKLKGTGQCFINLPEELFDLDYPGHYFRRIKSVSLSIPCVTGPFTTIGCTLTLMNNSLRTDSTSVADAKKYPRKSTNGIPADDPRFRDSAGTSQSIVLSHGQTDSGLFELNFRDERYLPFEGAGAISSWHLQFPFANTKDKSGTKVNTLLQQFDYNTITDVVMQVKYTAREGGDALKLNASDSLNNKINQMLVSLKDKGLTRIISARHEFPNEWYQFLNPALITDDQVLSINLTKDRFPFFVQENHVKINVIELAADRTAGSVLTHIPGIVLTPAPNPNAAQDLTADGIYGNLLHKSMNYAANNQVPGVWKITNPVANPRITADQVNDLMIILHYAVG
ncbi:neuraminidase-like domain-containing protein [Ferruginibacter paludis]|uniref:Tc toxin subunit A-related protein n=1 Tax=Ferruginibacter paludis TaxID=1310417 RepID=UPI0025B3B752|nr:neuraminidase-like domain-containing protein [Ferruginibacter paludis]MDN3657127.1 neuraminidase-like domain-containing protein [Ferruginibacter paludis]